MATAAPPRALDLFCGCGGLAEGARLAGFRVVAGIDHDPKYIATFRHNFPDAVVAVEDATQVDPLAFARACAIGVGDLELLMGGPPCQGFSKNVPRSRRHAADPRNLLVERFLDFAEALRPRLILMENVAEMRAGFDGAYTDTILRRLTDQGYAVSHAVLNAADFGVPQRRRRAFFLAIRAGKGIEAPTPPSPTHRAIDAAAGPGALPPHVSVWQAIGDLPPLRHGEGTARTPYRGSASDAYQRRARDPDAKTVANHVARFLQPTQLARLTALQPGQGHRDLPAALQVKSGYSGAYGRLTKEMVAPTITRWVFHPGSGRWGHPVDHRVLSIREVARIQGFPDSFEFVGSYTQQAGQLGNAVPPLLAAQIVATLADQAGVTIRSSTSTSPSNDNRSAADGSWNAMACGSPG